MGCCVFRDAIGTPTSLHVYEGFHSGPSPPVRGAAWCEWVTKGCLPWGLWPIWN